MHEVFHWQPHHVMPTTRPGKWAVGLAASVAALTVAVVTVVPGDSFAAYVASFAALALAVAAGLALQAAIFPQGERAVAVYAADLMLGGGVLFLLLHSPFMSA